MIYLFSNFLLYDFELLIVYYLVSLSESFHFLKYKVY